MPEPAGAAKFFESPVFAAGKRINLLIVRTTATLRTFPELLAALGYIDGRNTLLLPRSTAGLSR